LHSGSRRLSSQSLTVSNSSLKARRLRSGPKFKTRGAHGRVRRGWRCHRHCSRPHCRVHVSPL
jgi:hypothetical protein